MGVLRVTLRTTLKPIGAGMFSGPLEGHDDPALDVFVGSLSKDTEKYCAFWECVTHKDGGRTHALYASGKLHPTDDGYSGEIVSVRNGKPKGWRAVARKGSATISFEAI